MHKATKDHSGEMYGLVTVLHFSRYEKNRAVLACLCKCGRRFDASWNSLQQGKTVSCGCRKKRNMRLIGQKYSDKHRVALPIGTEGVIMLMPRCNHPDYHLWKGMVARCRNPKNKSYPRYGAIGITVCDSWADDFKNFIDDMGPRPSQALSIDRIDGSLGYEKSNCRWASSQLQSRNRRNNVIVQFAGEDRLLVELADEYRLPRSTVWQRVTYQGWTVPQALNLDARPE